MQPEKQLLAAIIVTGGVAVLTSYAYGVFGKPGSAALLWGGVPQKVRGLYTASMLLAALGYFFFTYYAVIKIDASAQTLGLPAIMVFSVLYAGILVASALWLPLVIMMGTTGAPWIWPFIRTVLFTVGICSGLLLAALWVVEPAPPGVSRWLALAGNLFFFFHTMILDALYWPISFKGG